MCFNEFQRCFLGRGKKLLARFCILLTARTRVAIKCPTFSDKASATAMEMIIRLKKVLICKPDHVIVHAPTRYSSVPFTKITASSWTEEARIFYRTPCNRFLTKELNREKRYWGKEWKQNKSASQLEETVQKAATLQGVSATLGEDYGKATVSKPLDIRGKHTIESLQNREL